MSITGGSVACRDIDDKEILFGSRKQSNIACCYVLITIHDQQLIQTGNVEFRSRM